MRDAHMTLLDYGRFQTQNSNLRELVQLCEKIALTMTPIYIFGEEGSGRRTLARLIHDKTPSRGRFITWSAEDFSFDSLKDGDTVLVENIHELESQQLVKLRRFIESLSDQNSMSVRLVVTSVLAPAEWMELSTQARDLAYRLCIVTLQMPSLAERREDLEGLAQMFVRISCLINNLPEKTLSEEALASLRNRNWIGNVAELNNVIERAVLKSDTSVIYESDLSYLFQSAPSSESEMMVGQSGMSLSEMERKLIFQTLEITRQNKTRAAQILGISIRTLRNKLNSYRSVEALA